MENTLADWLRAKLEERDLTIDAAAARAHVGVATISDILNQGHVPKIETLFRLAEAFDTSQIDILFISGRLRRGDQLPGAPQPACLAAPDPDLEAELLDVFRALSPETRLLALNHVRTLAHRSGRLPATLDQ